MECFGIGQQTNKHLLQINFVFSEANACRPQYDEIHSHEFIFNFLLAHLQNNNISFLLLIIFILSLQCNVRAACTLMLCVFVFSAPLSCWDVLIGHLHRPEAHRVPQRIHEIIMMFLNNCFVFGSPLCRCFLSHIQPLVR